MKKVIKNKKIIVKKYKIINQKMKKKLKEKITKKNLTKF